MKTSHKVILGVVVAVLVIGIVVMGYTAHRRVAQTEHRVARLVATNQEEK